MGKEVQEGVVLAEVQGEQNWMQHSIVVYRVITFKIFQLSVEEEQGQKGLEVLREDHVYQYSKVIAMRS